MLMNLFEAVILYKNLKETFFTSFRHRRKEKMK